MRLAASGFHGKVHYDISLAAIPLGSFSGFCELLLLQPLPAGVYADPYELKTWAGRTQGVLETRLFGEVDVENIESKSLPSALALRVLATLGAPGAGGDSLVGAPEEATCRSPAGES